MVSSANTSSTRGSLLGAEDTTGVVDRRQPRLGAARGRAQRDVPCRLVMAGDRLGGACQMRQRNREGSADQRLSQAAAARGDRVGVLGWAWFSAFAVGPFQGTCPLNAPSPGRKIYRIRRARLPTLTAVRRSLLRRDMPEVPRRSVLTVGRGGAADLNPAGLRACQVNVHQRPNGEAEAVVRFDISGRGSTSSDRPVARFDVVGAGDGASIVVEPASDAAALFSLTIELSPSA